MIEGIKCKDKLPEPGEKVLVYHHNIGFQLCHRGYKMKVLVWCYSWDCSRVIGEVNLWWPLPAMPNKTKS